MRLYFYATDLPIGGKILYYKTRKKLFKGGLSRT